MTSAIATAVYLGAVEISLERSSHISLRPKVSGRYTRLHRSPERCANHAVSRGSAVQLYVRRAWTNRMLVGVVAYGLGECSYRRTMG